MAWTIFAILAGIISVVGAIIGKKRNNRCTATTQGELADIETDGTPPDQSELYIYSYTVEGDYYEITTNSLSRSKEAKEIGDKCAIWYNPDNPSEAQPRGYSNVKFIIAIVVGLALIALGVYAEFIK